MPRHYPFLISKLERNWLPRLSLCFPIFLGFFAMLAEVSRVLLGAQRQSGRASLRSVIT